MASSLLVAYEEGENGVAVLLVGKKQPNGAAKIINAFQDEEATELWNKLRTRKEKSDENENDPDTRD